MQEHSQTEAQTNAAVCDCTTDSCATCGPLTKDSLAKGFAGEAIGTFFMCFMGIGAVATATLYGALNGPFQVGIIWGIAIALGIYTTRNLSCAHFNPAVTLAMCITGRCAWRNLPVYILGQFAGAIAAAGALWVLFKDTVLSMLSGAGMGAASAPSSIWLEVFPNTELGVVSPAVGAFAEGLGVFILVLVIFSMTEGCNLGRPSDDIFPLFIGLTISALITTIGPLTNAGLNPIRDLGPRIVGWLVGWKEIAFSPEIFLVYTIGPLLGGVLGALFFTKIVEPLQNK